jgi:hypothetical protein
MPLEYRLNQANVVGLGIIEDAGRLVDCESIVTKFGEIADGVATTAESPAGLIFGALVDLGCK